MPADPDGGSRTTTYTPLGQSGGTSIRRASGHGSSASPDVASTTSPGVGFAERPRSTRIGRPPAPPYHPTRYQRASNGPFPRTRSPIESPGATDVRSRYPRIVGDPYRPA